MTDFLIMYAVCRRYGSVCFISVSCVKREGGRSLQVDMRMLSNNALQAFVTPSVDFEEEAVLVRRQPCV